MKRGINILVISLLCLSFANCKTNRSVNGFKQGKWVLKDTINNVVYKQVAFYNKGEEVKKWRTYKDDKKYKTEKYKKGICLVTFYHPNGKVALNGKTKQEVSDNQIHWFYDGDWFLFDENGKLKATKIYEKGKLMNDFD